jgi:hypothetical protein
MNDGSWASINATGADATLEVDAGSLKWSFLGPDRTTKTPLLSMRQEAGVICQENFPGTPCNSNESMRTSLSKL